MPVLHIQSSRNHWKAGISFRP